MRLVHHRASEYEAWFRRLGAEVKSSVAGEIALLAEAWPVGMPRVWRLDRHIYELRFLAHGVRMYFTVEGDVIRFLAYGRKDTQRRDVERARRRFA